MPIIPEDPAVAELLFSIRSEAARNGQRYSLPVTLTEREEIYSRFEQLFRMGFVGQPRWTKNYSHIEVDILPSVLQNFD